MLRLRSGRRPPALLAVAVAASALVAPAAFADPADYVFVPYTTEGAHYATLGAGFERDRDGSHVNQLTASLGWSPTARWFTSVYAGWLDEAGAGFTMDEWSWLNHVQLAPPGDWPVDVGVLCELERPHDRAEGTGIVCGATLQLDTEQAQLNANPLLAKHVNGDTPGPWTFRYQWQAKTLVRPGLELGAQGFGEPSQHAHALGPAVFAKTTSFGGHPLALDAAVLVGLGDGAPRTTLRLRAQQTF